MFTLWRTGSLGRRQWPVYSVCLQKHLIKARLTPRHANAKVAPKSQQIIFYQSSTAFPAWDDGIVGHLRGWRPKVSSLSQSSSLPPACARQVCGNMLCLLSIKASEELLQWSNISNNASQCCSKKAVELIGPSMLIACKNSVKSYDCIVESDRWKSKLQFLRAE